MNLRDLYQTLDKEQREAFAKRVDIQAPYLWQIATQWKGKKPSLDLLKKIADADARLTVDELVREFTEDDPSKAEPKPDSTHATSNGKPAKKSKRDGPSKPASDKPTHKRGR